MTIAFLLTTLVVVATPGTGAVYTIGAGLARGWRASLIAAFGCNPALRSRTYDRGMFLFIGVFPRERLLAVMSFVCEYCRTPAEQRVSEIGSRLWLFFIPLFTFSRRYFVVCSHCGGTTELTREQAMNAADRVARNRQVA